MRPWRMSHLEPLLVSGSIAALALSAGSVALLLKGDPTGFVLVAIGLLFLLVFLSFLAEEIRDWGKRKEDRRAFNVFVLLRRGVPAEGLDPSDKQILLREWLDLGEENDEEDHDWSGERRKAIGEWLGRDENDDWSIESGDEMVRLERAVIGLGEHLRRHARRITMLQWMVLVAVGWLVFLSLAAMVRSQIMHSTCTRREKRPKSSMKSRRRGEIRTSRGRRPGRTQKPSNSRDFHGERERIRVAIQPQNDPQEPNLGTRKSGNGSRPPTFLADGARRGT
jgi:hypothetical protein